MDLEDLNNFGMGTIQIDNPPSSYSKKFFSESPNLSEHSDADDFGKAIESLNNSFKIPNLEMVAGNQNQGLSSIDYDLRKDLAQSLSSNQTYETRNINF